VRRLTVEGVPSVGFFGKLPSVGDFVRRRVDEGIVGAWDRWLQGAIASSRELLGERWLELYLTAPMWRFFAPAGTLDALPVAGVMFPSVDRVGRYFPLTVFARLPEHSSGLVVADRCAPWFERVEDLVLAQLEDDDHSIDGIDEVLAATVEQLTAGLHAVPTHLAGMRFEAPGGRLTGCQQLSLGERVEIGPTALAWLDQLIDRSLDGAMYWWSSGSASVRPSWLITRRLPEPRAYAAMLSGAWGEWPWEQGDRAESGMFLAAPPARFESAGTTHPGRVRSENQDAYLARPEIGLWVVADGMGGHASGQLASKATVDALAGLEPRAGFPDLVRAVHDTLGDVNHYLRSLSQRAVNPTVIGTTVVALLVRDGAGVCLWAGDSRLYRLRNGDLEQLTLDHSESPEGEGGGSASSSNVITRALGGQEDVELDQRTFDVQPGDRFLVCSDGLYRELDATALRAHLDKGDPASTTVAALLQRTLQGSALDNVTAVVVDALPGTV
jgi:type VI secretion system protein ImpM